MNIIIKNADFSASPLPRNFRLVRGFQLDDLLGLYLFEDGTVDATYGGPFTDTSGNGNSATIISGWSNPTRRSWGLEVGTANGLALNTGISAARTAHTVIVGAQIPSAHQAADAAVSNLAHMFFTTTTGLNASAGGNHSHNQTALGFHTPNNRVMIRDPNAWISATVRTYLGPTAGAAGQDLIIARTVDGPAPLVNYNTDRDTTGLSYTNASITTNFTTSQTGTYVIGAVPDNAPRATSFPQARLYGVAIYNTALDSTRLAAARAAMRALMVTRGLSPL